MTELPKQFADVENVLFGGPTRAAVLQPWEALLKSAYKMPGIMYREKVAKDPQSLREAAQMRKDLERSVGENGMFPTQPLQTQGGQDFASNFGKVLDTLKVPAAWPMAPSPTRPMLTGSDIRAMKGNVQNVARQVGDIPIDYRNAQSGFTRMDPVTGKPTVGAKAQALMDDWANISQRRQEVTGTSTFGGIAPETNMYAVRPDKGTRVIQPTRTEDTSTHPFYVDPLTNIISEVASVAELDNKRLLNRYTDLDSHRLPSQRGAALPVVVKRQLNNYITGRLQEIYPDVPIRSGEGGDDALHAAFQIGNKPTIRDQKLLGMYEDFFKTPDGKEALLRYDTLVPPSVHAERHAAASKWLNETFKNYLNVRIGTTADPLLQKAKQGVTYKPASELEGYAESVSDAARKNRIAGKFPETGAFLPEFHALGDRLEIVNAELNELDARKAELNATLPPESEMRGRTFNNVIPGYNDFMRKYDAKIAERNKLRKDMANLRIAQDYETLADAAVQPRIVSKVLNELPPQEVPFYPSLTKAPPQSIAYNLKKGTLGALGIEDMVSSFYNDVLTGKVPVEKLKGLTVDKYVQQHFDKRRLREIEEEKAAQTFLTNVNTVLQERVQQVPLDMHFYNTAVIEFDGNTPREQAYRDLSADSAILDHCVAEGGTAGDTKKHFLTGKQQRHEPLIDITTGKRNPNAIEGKQTSTYTEELYNNGVKLASVRDSTTGYPVATIRLERATKPGKYNATWVNGYRNGAIDRAYSEGIAAYLNSKADIIIGSGSDMQRHAGVFDTQMPADMRSLSQRVQGMSSADVRSLDFDFVELPRFVTQKQFNEIVAGAMDDTPSATAQQSRFAVESTADMRNRLTARQLDDANELHTEIMGQLEQVVYDAIQRNESPLSAQRDFLQAFRDDPEYYAGDEDPAIIEYALRFIEEQNPDIAPQDTQTALSNLEYTPSRALAQRQSLETMRNSFNAEQLNTANRLLEEIAEAMESERIDAEAQDRDSLFAQREFLDSLRNEDRAAYFGNENPAIIEYVLGTIDQLRPELTVPDAMPAAVRTRLTELDAEYSRVIDDIDEYVALEEQGEPIDAQALDDLRERAAQIRQSRSELRNQLAPQDTQAALSNLEYTPSQQLAQRQQEVAPPRSIDELYQMFLNIGEAALAQNDNFLGNDRFSFNSGMYSTNDLANGIRNVDPQLVGLDNLTQQERELLAHVVEAEGYNTNYFPGDYRQYDALMQPNAAPEQLAPPPAEVQLPPEDLGLFEPDPTHPANRPGATTPELARLNTLYDELNAAHASITRRMAPLIRQEMLGAISEGNLRSLEAMRD